MPPFTRLKPLPSPSLFSKPFPLATSARRSLATAAPAPASHTSSYPPPPFHNGPQPFYHGEPAYPAVHTAAVPGPRSQELIADLDEVFDTRALNTLVDYERSVGNYMADADGNMFLDVFAQIASIPLGYNNPSLAAACSSPEMLSSIINRPALGNFPPTNWASVLRSSLLSAAPPGLTNVFTAMAGSDANETAYKAAFMYRRQLERGGRDVDFTPEEMESVMNNKGPGASQLSILSFKTGFHGRLFGSLSTTRSKAIHKLDIPAFDWPQATFPQLKYPLEDHVAENAAAEQASLDEVEHLLQNWHLPPAAIVVEPIQSEGGDNHASPSYFRKLREITRKHGVLMIVDEVQTGVGATGKFWAHEHWGLDDPPDMVTFSKKAQAAGYYYSNPALRPNKPYRQFNTWMGDPARALLFRAINNEISRLDLVRNTANVGAYLYNHLEQLSKKYPQHFQNLRGKGQGTFIAFDTPKRDEFLKTAKAMGVNIGGSGAQAVRLRPMLVLREGHVDILAEVLEKVARQLS